MLYIHIVDNGLTLHDAFQNPLLIIAQLLMMILYVSEDYFSELHCVHYVDIETFDLHGLTVHDAFQNPLLIIAQQLIMILFEST